MTKQPSLSKEYQVLLKLIRLVLGKEPMKYFGEPAEPFPDDINWPEVVRLSYEQKVSALAVDGLNSSKYDPYQKLNEQKRAELQTILTPWFNDVKNLEDGYEYYLTILNFLCSFFTTHNFKPVILKGVGLAGNYPIPTHRGAGDIDLFLLDKDGKTATDKAAELVETELGIKTDKGPHDYKFTYKGIRVELHYSTTNPYWNLDYEQTLTKRMNELLEKNIIPFSLIENAYIPTPTFNAIYLIRHTFSHFASSSCTLRQYVDCVTFFTNNIAQIDWNEVNAFLTDFRMYDYSNGLMTLLDKWFNCPIGNNTVFKQDNRVEKITINEMHHYVLRGHKPLERIRYLYSNREKLYILTHETFFSLLTKYLAEGFKSKI